MTGAAAEQHPAEDGEVGGGAEQPRVAGDAAHAPGGRVVHDAAQQLRGGRLRTASQRPQQRSVGAIRGRIAAGGRNVVSLHAQRLEDPLPRELIERYAAHAADDVAEQKEVDVAVDEALAGRRGRHFFDRERDRGVGTRSTVGEIEIGSQAGYVREEVADRDVRLAVSLEPRDVGRDPIVQPEFDPARPAS